MEIKWRDLITAIVTVLVVLGGGELTNTVDIEFLGNETECEPCPPEITCPLQITCPNYSIAYVNNCRTGETDKYICNEKGDCKSTQEILSELG